MLLECFEIARELVIAKGGKGPVGGGGGVLLIESRDCS